MNTPVNFEIAKLLKEKGFDIPCQFLRVGGKYRINQEKEGDLFDNKYPSTQIPNDWFLAPTIADVVMWLYDKYGIWISVECDCYGQLWFSKLSVASEKNWDNIDLRHEIISAVKKFPNEHNSPTDAYEAAITYTLNNLI